MSTFLRPAEERDKTARSLDWKYKKTRRNFAQIKPSDNMLIPMFSLFYLNRFLKGF